MNCTYCKKLVYGMTGLQEIQKFQKHMRTCKESPRRHAYVDEETGKTKYINDPVDMIDALYMRAESGQ